MIFFQPLFDFKAARRGDVFQIDAAKLGFERRDDLHELVDVLRLSGKAERRRSRLALEEDAFSFHDGMPASGPMLPSPSTAEPSAETATCCFARVSVHLLRVVFDIARQGRGDAGRVAMERSSWLAIVHLVDDFPAFLSIPCVFQCFFCVISILLSLNDICGRYEHPVIHLLDARELETPVMIVTIRCPGFGQISPSCVSMARPFLRGPRSTPVPVRLSQWLFAPVRQRACRPFM